MWGFLLLTSVLQAWGQGRGPPLELVTVTNDANKAQRLLQSAPLPVRILGPLGKNVSTWGYLKDLHFLMHVRELMRRGYNNTVVILLDAWDIAYLGCDRDLLRAFHALKKPLFFSAELAFYPWGAGGHRRYKERMGHAYPYWGVKPGYWALPRCSVTRDAHQPCRSRHRPRSRAAKGQCSYCVPVDRGGGSRFLNIGCWGGYAWAVERALTRLYDNGEFGAFARKIEDTFWFRRKHELGDQPMWTLYAMSHRSEIALDYGASMCTSLHGLHPRKDLIPRAPRRTRIGDGRKRRIFAAPFGKDICFAHANGGHDVLLDKLLKATGPTPWSQRFGPSASVRIRYGRPLTAASEELLPGWSSG